MNPGAGTVRLGVNTRMIYDGETVEVVETAATTAGNEVVLKDGQGRLLRVAVRELLFSERVAFLPDGPGPAGDDDEELAAVVLSQLGVQERQELLELAEHVREVRCGYRSGSAELARPDEPRPGFDPTLPKMARYQAKADELGVSPRTVRRWVTEAAANEEAGLAVKVTGSDVLERCDRRWVETATEVMVEHVEESSPSRKMVIDRTRARVVARFGQDVVTVPGRTLAYEALEALERRHPTFRFSTKRNRDIAGRPTTVYGKLRPTRPGEYMLMDTTRLDVFAMDPLTLRWVNCELSVAMDWYTRCITGIRLTPVSTKSVDAALVLFQAYRPLPVLPGWPASAVWPEHGIPRSVLVDTDAVDGPIAKAAGPALVPETIVVDHGKIYVSEHLTSVCARMGISVQPVRLRTGRDKGPIERFFRTLREDVLQVLPGYKGPDIHGRGVDPEGQAFFYIDELEAKIREWVAVVYHHRTHDGLLDAGVRGLRMSPAQAFAHGMARAGYIEVPRDRHLGLEFLPTRWRTIQPYGVEIDGCRYDGDGLYRDGRKSPYRGGRWPVQVDPDDVTRAYFRDLDRQWHVLTWEHAPHFNMPLSLDALVFARRLAADRFRYPNDRLAMDALFERWSLGLGATPAERRIALRMSRETSGFAFAAGPEPVSLQPSARLALAAGPAPEAGPTEPEGDDDAFDVIDGEVDFYADAIEDVED